MISSIKSTAATSPNDNMVIMPLNDDEDAMYTTSMVATSMAAAFQHNYADATKTFNNIYSKNINNNNNDNTLSNNTDNGIIMTTENRLSPATAIEQSATIKESSSENLNKEINLYGSNKHEIPIVGNLLLSPQLSVSSSTVAPIAKVASASILKLITTTANDTQTLKFKNNKQYANLIKSKTSNTAPSSIIVSNHVIANSVAVSNDNDEKSKQIDGIKFLTSKSPAANTYKATDKHKKSEILFNSNSTIPINNAKDFISNLNNKTNNNNNNLLNGGKSKQIFQIQRTNNLGKKLVNATTTSNTNTNNSIIYTNCIVSDAETKSNVNSNQFSKRNGFIVKPNNIVNKINYINNNNNIVNESALLSSSSSKPSINSHRLNFYNATPAASAITKTISLKSAPISAEYHSISTQSNASLPSSAPYQKETTLKLMKPTVLQNSAIYSTKLFKNIKISPLNKLSDKGTTKNTQAITTIGCNSFTMNTAKETTSANRAATEIKNIKPKVGFISLEQNGWNLNFITTTNLVPITSVSSAALSTSAPSTTPNGNGAVTKTDTSQIFTKLSPTITASKVITKSASNNANGDNRQNVLGEKFATTGMSPSLSSNNSQVNSETMVSRSLIEDVHNYSKKSKRFPAECISTTNSSVEESEEDDDDNDNDDDDDEDDDYGEEGADGGNTEFDYRKFLTTSNRNENRKRSAPPKQEIKFRDVGSVGAKKSKIDKNKLVIVEEQQDKDDEIDVDDDQYNKTQQDNSCFERISAANEEALEKSLRPEHHARRPMNAFLIFCKRHRAIVRDKYKNVENRQVTKILGEWWENMTPEEKGSYTNLAKEYKDAFLSANPNFKWYKLPAPPLRTLSMRPINLTESSTDDHSLSPLKPTNQPNQTDESLPSTTNQMAEKSDPQKTQKVESDNVGMFKFADETQMGGLSSLMSGGRISPGSCNSPEENKPQKLSDQEVLQSALEETSQYMSLAMSKSKSDMTHLEPFEKMRSHAKEMQMSISGKKRKNLDDSFVLVGGKKLIRDSSFSSGEDDNFLRKPSRSCKGKKYQALVISGQIVTSSKKVKKNNVNSFTQSRSLTTNKDSSSDSDGTASNAGNTGSSPSKISVKDLAADSSLRKLNQTKSESNEIMMQSVQEGPDKPFDTNAFDLESKIMALPAQDLEEYLQKKQESKCKKKIATKRRKNFNVKKSTKQSANNASASLQASQKLQQKQQIIAEQRKQQEQIVGSQKRKARKESITRRDLNSGLPAESKAQPTWLNLNDLKMEENPISVLDPNEMVVKEESMSATINFPTLVQSNSNECIQQLEKDSDQMTTMLNQNNQSISTPQIAPNTDLLILAEVAIKFDE